MTSWSVTTFLAIALFGTFATATVVTEDEIDFNDAEVKEKFEKAINEYSTQKSSVLVRRRQPRLLNIPGLIRPFCLKTVGTVQSAPKICDSVAGFVVDATNSACKESFREICRWAVGTTFGCEGIIKLICPSRSGLEQKIKPSVNKYCAKSLQAVVDKFGQVASNVEKEALCNSFVEGVRKTCHHSIGQYCESDKIREIFKFPCSNFLPGIVCD